MPNKFAIRQVISSNNRGRIGERRQITVDFQGRVVTRHIVDGVGRHPDESLPKRYAGMTESIQKNQKLQQDKLEAVAALQKFGEKKPKGFEDIMRRVAVEALTGITPAKAKDLAAKMELERQRLVDELPILIGALEAEQKEDPLMVHYF